tara:strand:+ start:166 stop:705 length:540 start_codon:yes stop_codon:yes gene_type:complete
MLTDKLKRYLNSFGKQVVNRAKGNLQKKKGGNTNLEQTIKFDIVQQGDNYQVVFTMAEYGTYLDKGVSGTKVKQKFKNYQNKTISSPYKYTTKQPPPNILAKWISKKGIKGRDKDTGRFISNMSLAYLIGKKIKRDGIKSLAFFQKPLGLGLKQFGGDILNIIKEDITKSVQEFNTNVK